jgi:hypothetical protein
MLVRALALTRLSCLARSCCSLAASIAAQTRGCGASWSPDSPLFLFTPFLYCGDRGTLEVIDNAMERFDWVGE